MEPPSVVKEHSKRRVSYFYDTTFGDYKYSVDHYMQPLRVKMTHILIQNYSILDELSVFRPPPASYEDITRFHSEDYINTLKKENPPDEEEERKYFTFDTPKFKGVFPFSQLACGGSLAAASKLNRREADIAINWMGGFHHAKKDSASGFCYTNDIVLGILELLKYHTRVLYVDIDVHHGDGVEEAFRNTDRVMTVSFHQYEKDFFPTTGSLMAKGVGDGENYMVNVPLRKGITDVAYFAVFKQVMSAVMERYQPEAVVLQCGADSINDDRLGSFNMTLKGHGSCVSFMRKYNIPLMLLGGGGYTVNNVARCWTYETALAVGMELKDEIPYNGYFQFFGPSYKLHLDADSNVCDQNSNAYIHHVIERVFERLRSVNVTGVQMQPLLDVALPKLTFGNLFYEPNPEDGISQELLDEMVRHPGEFYDVKEWRRNQRSAKKSAVSGEKVPR